MARETFTLSAQQRAREKRAKALRRQGLLPLVMYGHGVESQSLVVERSDFERLLHGAGQSSVIMLGIDGEKQERPVLIQDVQFDALRDMPIHADLYQVRMDEAIETEVPLLFTGEASAVKEQEGVLVKNHQSLNVRALPMDLPHEIEVSLNVLTEIDDAVRVGDLQLSEGVDVIEDDEEVIVTVVPPRSEEELEELDEAIDEAAALEGIEDVEEDEEEAEEEGEEGEEEGHVEESDDDASDANENEQ